MIGRLLRSGFMTAIYAYLYIPIIILIVNSFNSSRFGINWQGFTTKWYGLLMNNDSLLQAAQHSLTMAVLSATFATLIGSLTAVALYRYRFRGKPFVSGMLFVVMMSPDIVMAISLLVLFMLLGIQLGALLRRLRHPLQQHGSAKIQSIAGKHAVGDLHIRRMVANKRARFCIRWRAA